MTEAEKLVRLKGLHESFPTPWGTVYHLAAMQAAEREFKARKDTFGSGGGAEMNHGRSGWHKEQERQRVGAFSRLEASEWEQLLARLGIAEGDAAQAMREGWPGAAELGVFVRERFTRFYVPEDVLRGMGLSDAVERSQGLAWCELRPAWLTQGYARPLNYAKRLGGKRSHA